MYYFYAPPLEPQQDASTLEWCLFKTSAESLICLNSMLKFFLFLSFSTLQRKEHCPDSPRRWRSSCWRCCKAPGRPVHLCRPAWRRSSSGPASPQCCSQCPAWSSTGSHPRNLQPEEKKSRRHCVFDFVANVAKTRRIKPGFWISRFSETSWSFFALELSSDLKCTTWVYSQELMQYEVAALQLWYLG